MQLHKLKVIEFDQLESTNNHLKENYSKYDNITIIKTKYQTKGRGQFERNWESLKGENLLMSILLKDIKLESIDIIKKIVTETLLIYLDSLNIKGNFKEPNDIYVNNKKILGILIETKVKQNTNFFDYIIIGLGININQETFKNENAVSVYNLINKKVNLDKALMDISAIFMKLMNFKISTNNS